MGVGILVAILASIVWATLDARRRDLTQASHGPTSVEGYMIGMVFLWIVFFPLYLTYGWKAPLFASATHAVPIEPTRFKQCPDCAETVMAEAKVCKHCHYRF